jgi:hypothetical protein
VIPFPAGSLVVLSVLRPHAVRAPAIPSRDGPPRNRITPSAELAYAYAPTTSTGLPLTAAQSANSRLAARYTLPPGVARIEGVQCDALSRHQHTASAVCWVST